MEANIQFNQNINIVNDNHNVNVSKYRQAASQCFATLATNILKFTYGNFAGFTTLLIAELYKEDAEIKVTKSDLSWFSSYLFMGPVGAIIVGLVSQRFGSRTTLLVTSTLFATCWIIFYCATSSAMLLVAQAIVGVASSVIFVCGYTYVAEIAQPHLRGALMASSSLSIILGSFFTVLIGKILHWRSVCLLNLIFPVLGLICMSIIPHSPHWLASRKRFDEAEKSLAWLRGWIATGHVKYELSTIKDIHATPQGNPVANLTIDHCRERSFYLPLLTICYVYLIQNLAGSHTVQAYAIVIFRMAESPFDEHLAAVIFDLLRIVGALVCIASIHLLGKRKLMFASLALSGASCLVASATIDLIQRRHVDSDLCKWISTLAIILSTFAFAAGIDKIVSMLNGELYPSRSRDLGAGVGLFVGSTLSAIMGKVFLYAVEAATLQGVFLLFAVVCAVGLVTLYYVLPETEGRTLTEIEDYYASCDKSRK